MDIWSYQQDGQHVVHFMSPAAKRWLAMHKFLHDIPGLNEVKMSCSDYAQFTYELLGTGLTLFEDDGREH